jgi:hypothetical protein
MTPKKAASKVGILTIMSVGLMMILAISTFVVSYDSLVGLAKMAGLDGYVASLWPLGIDGLMVIAAFVRMNYGLNGKNSKWATGILGGTALLSVFLNVAHVVIVKVDHVSMWIMVIDAIVFAIPPMMLFFSSEMALSMLKEVVEDDNKRRAAARRAATRRKTQGKSL